MNNTHKDISFFTDKQKRELLSQLLQKKDFFPLSFAQQRLWFLNQLEPSSAFYNISHAIRLTGFLNVPALEQTLNEIVLRHEALRTSFMTVEGQPIQVIDPTLTISLPIVDLRKFSEVEREAEVLRLTTEEARRPFNLAKAPLLRATLLHLSEVEQVVLFTMHHIVSDDWSMKILIKEVAALYQAFNLGQPSALVELPIQYADFAVWQQQWLQGEELQTQLFYWIQQLDGAPSMIELPTDFPRPAIQNYQGARQSIVLPKSLTQALKKLSQQEGTTLFMTLLAAFKVFLYHYTQQNDILVGTPIANRNRSEIEGLIGFFVNTLVLRTDLGGNPSFRELLRRVRQVTLEAYTHQDLPFEYLVEKLQPQRDLSYSPLFQVMFALQNVRKDELKLPGITLSSLQLEKQTAQFDLSVDFFETESGLSGWFEYNTDLFDASTVTRMVKHFCKLLSDIVANPEQHIAELSLLTQVEQQQLLVEWNNTQAEYIQDKCIHELFEAQVERSPDAIAVTFEDKHLTYQQLNEKSNQLAHYLRSLGVKPEVLVGIFVERSLEMVVGLLAILKAGGTYLPVDPAYPKERLAFMLEDAQISVLLTQQRLLAELPKHEAQVVCLDTDWLIIAQESQENLLNRFTPENLAYVIYTSGSTGRPKGVMIQHNSLVNYIKTACLEYELESSDRILQFASISFDTAAEEIFPCLVQGATLVLRTDSMLSSIPSFLQTCQALNLTVLDLPTAFWHQLTAELAEESLQLPEQLRLVIIGGEKALSQRLGIWQKYVEQRVQLINSYGPTEATIVATMSNLSKLIQANAALEVPIGRGINNVQIYILNTYLQPTPIGVPGELYIGGVGVARGYLNLPELTAIKFIPNPFSKESGSRLYKTGDLARYLPNGDIEILGRIDDQVKIRGFRIELGEIEARLNQHAKVREAVVVTWGDELTDKRLVAYVSAQPKQEFTITELRSFLKEKLPEYMIPSAFVLLETLPLTPNGKLDRRSLPAPETLRPELEAAYVMPQTEIEQTIATIWQKSLNIEKIGIHDNFFELGGHSLLLVKINSQLREIFKIDLSMLDMFRYPTISSLAELFSQIKNKISSFSETNISIEKIASGKSQQRKRLQKMKSMANNQGDSEE